MGYYCRSCHTYFADPRVLHFPSHNPYEPSEELECCPFCGDDSDFSLMDECPCCGGYKDTGEYLCTNCRTKLKMKFRKFRDHLVNAELEELDDMLDGASVRDI